MTLKLTIIFSFLFIATSASTQLNQTDLRKIDSLKAIIQNSKVDTNIVRAYQDWDNMIYFFDPILDYSLNEKIDSICSIKLNSSIKENEKKFYQSFQSGALNNLGILERRQGNFNKSVHFHLKALALQKELNDEKGLGNSYNNIGIIYESKGDYNKAIQYYNKSLKIREKIGDRKGVASSYGNIGIIYNILKNYPKALDFFNKSLIIQKEIKNKKGEAFILVNIGIVYFDKADKIKWNKNHKALQEYQSSALQYLLSALQIQEEIHDSYGKANTLGNIASVYTAQGNLYQELKDASRRNNKYDSALLFLEKSILIKQEIQDEQGIGNSWGQMGVVYYLKGEYVKAILYLNKSLEIAKKVTSTVDIRDASESLWKSYKSIGDFKNALEMYEIYIQTRDSIQRVENHKEIIRQEYKYEYEKRAAKDSIKIIEEKKVNEAKIAQQEAEANEQRKQKWLIGTALIGALALVVVTFVMLARIRKSNKIILQQKKEVEAKKEEADTQRNEAEYQKHIVEEKNKEITDSITYAKRIQSAILPPQKIVKEYLPSSFILYKPKDIVAGDFYWMETVKGRGTEDEGQEFDTILFAACDCTGHGVPGAMVSVVCNNALNRSVREYGLSEPGKILDKTREIVIQEFEKSEEDVKDGMDISLVSLACRTKNENESGEDIASLSLSALTLKYSGANNPLWIIRHVRLSSDDRSVSKSSGDYELIEYKADSSAETSTKEIAGEKYRLIEVKADKQPIGKYTEPLPFTTHDIELQKGDTIYIFTDGFQDQFGGEKGKKLKAKAFKDLLLSIQDKSMEKQREMIDEIFETWKGNLEQNDDVCVIGIRI